MSQQSSLTQSAHSVRQVLTAYSARLSLSARDTNYFHELDRRLSWLFRKYQPHVNGSAANRPRPEVMDAA